MALKLRRHCYGYILYGVVLKVNFIFSSVLENRSTWNPVTFYAVNCYRTSRKADHNAGRFYSCYPECRNDHWMCFRWWKTCSYGKWCICIFYMLYMYYFYTVQVLQRIQNNNGIYLYLLKTYVFLFLFMLDLSIIFRDDKICKHYSYDASVYTYISN